MDTGLEWFGMFKRVQRFRTANIRKHLLVTPLWRRRVLASACSTWSMLQGWRQRQSTKSDPSACRTDFDMRFLWLCSSLSLSYFKLFGKEQVIQTNSWRLQDLNRPQLPAFNKSCFTEAKLVKGSRIPWNSIIVWLTLDRQTEILSNVTGCHGIQHDPTWSNWNV